MEFTLEAGELARIVGLVKGMVPARTTIPILSNILIEAADGSVNIRATCLDMEASASAIAEVVTPGAVTVPGHVLHSLAKSLPKTKLATFKLDDGSRPVLTCGKSRYELRALDPGDFPSANPIGKSAVRFSMPGPDLVALLAGTLPSVETDAKTRYYLCGVFLHVYKDNLVAVSTDGHRMARIASDVPPGAAGMPAIIIPTGAAQEIVAMAGDSDVDIAITPTCIEVMTDKSRLWSKLFDGTYPDYQRVIPVRSNTVASVDRDEMVEAVARAALVYAGNVNAKRYVIACSVNGGTLDLASGDGGTDQGSESIAAEDCKSGAVFGVASHYLSEMVGLWPAKSRITIQVDGTGPVMLTSPSAPNQTHVIMPMRI